MIEHERRILTHKNSSYAYHHRHNQLSNVANTGLINTKEYSAEAVVSPFHNNDIHGLSLKQSNSPPYDSFGQASEHNGTEIINASHSKVFKNSIYRRVKRVWVSGLIHLRMVTVIDLESSSLINSAPDENSIYKPLAG